MNTKEKVLFVCNHNSARSQMAKAMLNNFCHERFEAESAGLEPGVLNKYAIQAMHDIGIDISQQRPQSVFDLYKSGKRYSYVIAVCDQKTAEQCPIFPMFKEKIHWQFPDPSQLIGTEAEKLQGTIEIRDAIKTKILAWCEPYCCVENAA